jgi:ribosome-associated toxin RatA of RatAB toxin-antitoxin module
MVPRRQHASAAGQRARRLLICAALITIAASAPSAADDQSVTVTERAGIYQVSATFAVPKTPADAVAVLMDFEKIPDFVPDMKTSTVIERTDGNTVVEQEAVARFMMFSKTVHLVLNVSEDGGVITFRDRCGKSFAVYEGSWTVKPSANGATITYRLAAKPSFDVPGFVLKRLLKRDASELIARIKAEITTRGNVRK